MSNTNRQFANSSTPTLSQSFHAQSTAGSSWQRPKFAVSRPDGEVEQEAREASIIARTGISADSDAGRRRSVLQRSQLHPILPAHSLLPIVPATVEQTLESSGQPMDTAVRSFMEPRFGYNFADVRVHDDATANESAAAINAAAYASGKHVVFGAGQYQPATETGRTLIAHELTHVIQQRGWEAGVISRQLFTPLGAGGGFGGLMDRDRARSRQPTQSRPPISLQRVKLWFNTFIPQISIDGPPFHDCFLGDARGFSSRLGASSRTHQEIEFAVPSLAVLGKVSRIGTTHEVTCDNWDPVAKGTASVNEVYTFDPVIAPTTRHSFNNIAVMFVVSASNPLVTAAPSIDAVVSVTVDPHFRTVSLSGVHDGFPAYEAYVSIDDGPPSMIYGFDPATAGNDISSLFPPMDIAANDAVRVP